MNFVFSVKQANRISCQNGRVKHIAVLGSSGSIGESTLKVIRSQRKYFRVASLSVNSDIDTLYKQIKEFKPFSVCVQLKKISESTQA